MGGKKSKKYIVIVLYCTSSWDLHESWNHCPYSTNNTGKEYGDFISECFSSPLGPFQWFCSGAVVQCLSWTTTIFLHLQLVPVISQSMQPYLSFCYLLPNCLTWFNGNKIFLRKTMFYTLSSFHGGDIHSFSVVLCWIGKQGRWPAYEDSWLLV